MESLAYLKASVRWIAWELGSCIIIVGISMIARNITEGYTEALDPVSMSS